MGAKPESVKTWQPAADTAAVEPIPERIRLSVSPYVVVARRDDLLTEINLGARKVKFDPETSKWATPLIDALQGRTLEEAAAHVSMDLGEATEFIQQLYHHGALDHVGDLTIPAMTFASHIAGVTLIVQARLGEAFSRVAPAPTRRLALGRLIEQYHFISSNPAHVSPLILNAPNERLRMMWADYFSDEYWHGTWIRDGLRAAGLSDADIEGACPLPGTTGMIRHLQWTAMTDPEAYAVCLSAGESLAVTVEAAKRQYEELGKLVDESVLAPFREHAIYDIIHDHGSLAGEVFAEGDPVTARRQRSIRQTMLTYHHLVFEQELQLARYYSDETAPIPFTVGQLPTARAL